MRAAFEAVFLSILVGDATAEAEPCHRAIPTLTETMRLASPFCAILHAYDL